MKGSSHEHASVGTRLTGGMHLSSGHPVIVRFPNKVDKLN